MTGLRAGALDARNIGSTIGFRDEAEQAEVLGTIQYMRKLDSGEVELTFCGGKTATLATSAKVDVTLPPAAHFQHQAVELMDSALAELEDLSEEVVAYIKGKLRAAATTVQQIVPEIPVVAATPAVMARKAMASVAGVAGVTL